MNQDKKRRFLHLAILVSVTMLVFSNTLENDYHLDSINRVAKNTEIDTFWPPLRFFTDVRTGSTVAQIAEYRPMMPLSNAINSEISRVAGIKRLTGFHLGNIAIHIGSTLLVYLLFCLLISNWGRHPYVNAGRPHFSHLAFAGALIFGVHPISGSAVNYIAARDLLLMVFFFLASVHLYIGMRSKGDTVLGWVFSLVLLGLAILSKQVAILGFGLIFLFEWLLKPSKLADWRLWARTALFSLPTAGYFLLRALWISPQNPSDGLRTATGMSYPLTMLDAHTFYYLRNFFWPFEMRALAKVEMVESLLEPTAVLGLLVILASLVIAWMQRKANPLVTFCILAYWLLFSLTSSIFPFQYVVTDYRQYLPFVFLALLSSVACFSLKRTGIAVAMLFMMAIYFSMSSFHINRHWKTEESFWGQSVKYGAVDTAHNNYALEVVERDPELGEFHFREALRQYPDHIYANISLAMLEIRQGKEDEGLKRLRRMVALNPEWALSHHWLAVGLKKTGNAEESVQSAKRAADVDPRSIEYQYEAARALHSNGNLLEAIEYYKRALRINPGYKKAGFWQGFALQKSGESSAAIAAYRQYLGYHPEHIQTHFNLAYELMRVDEFDDAIVHFLRVLEYQPSYTESHMHLASCYRKLGEESKAIEHERAYQDERQ